MFRPRRVIFIFIGITLLLSGCTALKLREANHMLTDYYLTLNQAKADKDWKLIETTTAAMDALSKEAGKQAAEENEPLNQISFYRIAATAAWQANSAEVVVYAKDGSRLCSDQYFNKAPRDCSMLLVIPYLAGVDELVPTFNDYQARIDSPSAEKPSMTDLSNLFGKWEKLLLGILNQHAKIKKSATHPELKKAVDDRARKILCSNLRQTRGLMIRLSGQDLENDAVQSAADSISKLKVKMAGLGITGGCL